MNLNFKKIQLILMNVYNNKKKIQILSSSSKNIEFTIFCTI